MSNKLSDFEIEKIQLCLKSKHLESLTMKF